MWRQNSTESVKLHKICTLNLVSLLSSLYSIFPCDGQAQQTTFLGGEFILTLQSYHISYREENAVYTVLRKGVQWVNKQGAWRTMILAPHRKGNQQPVGFKSHRFCYASRCLCQLISTCLLLSDSCLKTKTPLLSFHRSCPSGIMSGVVHPSLMTWSCHLSRIIGRKNTARSLT